MLTIRYIPTDQESTIYSHVIPRAVRRLADGTHVVEYGIRDACYAAWRTLCDDKCFHRPDGPESIRYAELLHGGQIKGEANVVDFPTVVAIFDNDKELIFPRSRYPIDLDVDRAVGYMEKFHNSKKPFEV